MNRNIIHLLTLSLLLFCGCSQGVKSEKQVIYVSIAPIKYIVEQIAPTDFDVKVLVPAGASPETFELTAKQYIDLNESAAIMSVGLLDFEKSILSRLDDKRRLVNLSEGVELLEGSCSHDHSHDHSHGDGHAHHHHGIDPHIWTSPVELQRMAANCYMALSKINPDSVKYMRGYQLLHSRLEQLDARITGNVLASGIESFVIYHPAYSYFARDYNLEQIAIEDEGKEPSARRIADIIDHLREHKIEKILYQSQFPSSVVDVIAKDAAAQSVSVDPLSEDIVAHIEDVAQIITGRQ